MRSNQVSNALFFFVVHQGEKARPILDCSPLNQYLRCPHFKMEDMRSAIELIRSNDWLTKIDIKDAYLHVPLHPSASKQLGIQLSDGSMWEFKAMPFGLNVAPLIFTRIMRAALKPLRREGIRLVAYLDDILIISESKEQAVNNTRKTIQWLERLGFVINAKKSVLCPTQRIEFLGMLVDTRKMNLSVPPAKIVKVQREARQIMRKDNWPARKLAATIGLMNSVCRAMSPGMLMTRYLLANLKDALIQNGGNWDTTRVRLWETSKQELSWWSDEITRYNGRPFRQPTTELTVYTDASETGWGGVCGRRSYSGAWTETDYSSSSNMRELKAIQKVILAMGETVKNRKLLILSDNITAIANVVKEGGNNNVEYIQQLKELYWTMKQLDCTIIMRYIPGERNVFADVASRRNFRDEYQLTEEAMNQIVRRWGEPTIDLFATSENNQVPRFYSWKADRGAVATDAFAQPWGRERLPYAHPPIRLIPKVILKSAEERVRRMILVLPHWPSLPFWPLLARQTQDHIMLPDNCLEGPPLHRLAIQRPRMIALLLMLP